MSIARDDVIAQSVHYRNVYRPNATKTWLITKNSLTKTKQMKYSRILESK